MWVNIAKRLMISSLLRIGVNKWPLPPRSFKQLILWLALLKEEDRNTFIFSIFWVQMHWTKQRQHAVMEHYTSTISWQMTTSRGTLLLLSCEVPEVLWLGRFRIAVVSSYSDPKAVDPFAPCLLHTPPRKTWLVHPSVLHRLVFAPCLMHTPPFTATFMHPSAEHILAFAPCLIQTPPRLARFVHPSLLHFIFIHFAPFFALCLMHTPPLTARFVHSSLLHFFLVHVAPCLIHTPPFCCASISGWSISLHTSSNQIFLMLFYFPR